MSAETPTRTLTVAFILCVVFSFLVSTTAVLLKDKQEYNKEIDLKKNILLSAGLLSSKDASASVIEQTFQQVEAVVVNIEQAVIVEGVDPATLNIKTDVKNDSKSIKINSSDDVAALNRRPINLVVYLVRENNIIKGIILPVVSKGLWSTMYGFIALEADANTVTGFAYYEQGETPGLGGEVDNPKWKSQWIGKKIYNESGQPIMMLKKGAVTAGETNYESKVDGLSGATITSNGVTTSIAYWLGDKGFGPFLSKLRSGEIQ